VHEHKSEIMLFGCCLFFALLQFFHQLFVPG
jgi:hypothetical protein